MRFVTICEIVKFCVFYINMRELDKLNDDF